MFFVLLFACQKNEQSCADGILDPEKEEKIDCGGVCPPCNFTPTEVSSFLTMKINGVKTTFDNNTLLKSPEFILSFNNDTIDVKLNFGSGDSLGARAVNVVYSEAIFNQEAYPILNDGIVVFSEVNTTQNELSGFFKARFTTGNTLDDTLRITEGEFQNIKWE
ncbi:hypothetical protein CW751_08465 [Brumimicrobium salinarum]|uniref:Uncharacterized protein n=1 Tax=Brumimicrobium salinarum TaxID=2058658 RepID=A0A2I0R2I0_9FLAO|nr:hypothetical protein CW751_08465 [Brumimicrobium salinarum]